MIVALSFAAIILGLGAEVVSRYALGKSLFGMSEILVIPMFWLYFLGASLSSHDGGHISANILDTYLKKERPRLLLESIVAIVTLAISVVLTYWAVLYFIDAVQRDGRSNVLGIPLTIPQSAVLIGFCLMAFYTAVRATQAVLKLTKHSETEN
ncbi:TRAP transporter small permease [Brevibacterium sp. UBA7493]|uniref:TRAP transporter small permease n=1 Tax=Brevibacterium sp. UBA7493 TaxID=1946121 RepID=UPI00257BEBA0|nr:TRAP transporter small permease [Brevibacterium sp. UBA7493]